MTQSNLAPQHIASAASIAKKNEMRELKDALRNGKPRDPGLWREVFRRRDEWPEAWTISDALKLLPMMGPKRLAKLGRAAAAANINLLTAMGDATADIFEWLADYFAGERDQRSAARKPLAGGEDGAVTMYFTRSHLVLLNAVCRRDKCSIEDAIAEAAEALMRPRLVRTGGGDPRVAQLMSAIQNHRVMVRSEHLPADAFGKADDALYARAKEIVGVATNNERRAA